MTLRLPSLRMTSRAVMVLAVGLAVLLAGALPASVRGAEPQKVPDAPDKPTGKAIYAGMVDLEWNDLPEATSYDVQFYWDGAWNDLPGNGIDIAFYGAGAILRNLPEQGVYHFRVRARNALGPSEWSEYLFMEATATQDWDDVPEPTNTPATGAPAISGKADAGETLAASISDIEDENGLARVKFSYQWTSGDGTADSDIEGATGATYTLRSDDAGKAIKVRVTFTDRGGYAESLTSSPVKVDGEAEAQPANAPATGAPTISGTARVGETLTADTSGIADADGLSGAAFSYQWLSNDGSSDTEIEGATGTTYTLRSDDEGKTIKVRVTFTDDGDHDEFLTSAPTEAVTARPTGICDRTPLVRDAILAKIPNVSDCSAVTDADLSGVTGTLGLKDSGIAALQSGDFSGLSNLEELYLGDNGLSALPEGLFDDLSNLTTLGLSGNGLSELPDGIFDGLSKLEILYLGNNIGLTTLPDGVFSALSNLTILGLSNTGLSELTDGVFGSLSSLEILYLGDNSNLSELPDGVFGGLSNLEQLDLDHNSLRTLPAGVFYGLSSLKYVDLADNPGAPFTLTVELEQRGDDAFVVKVAHGTPSDMTVTLAAEGGTLSDTTVTIDGGSVTSEEISVTPDDTGQVTIGFESVATKGAVVSDLDETELIVSQMSRIYKGIHIGFGEPLVLGDAESVNTPATGAPTISGTEQVGETLTVSTSGIADADGLSGTTFSYQWLSSRDTEIPGATDSTYTLLDADEGKLIKVRVTFTDDAGNEESLTSSATAAVAASAQTDSEHEPSLRSYITVVVTEDASDPDNVETRFTITWSDVDDCSTGYNAYLSNGMDVARGGDTTHLGSAATDGSQITRSLSNVEGEGIIFRVGLYCGTEDSGRLVSSVSIPHDGGPSSEESNRRLVPSTYSSEPPLTGLTVSPGTLTPTFHSHTLNTVLYTVPDVVSADDRLTLVATAKPDYSVVFVKDVLGFSIVCSPWSFSCTGWSYKDEDGNRVYPLTDADANSPGFQVDLAVGEKLTIHVHREYRGTPVEDGSYRLTVTRASNSPATGTPIISGTAQVGETLTVDTSGIDDSDGLSAVTYRYQWISNDGTADSDIQSATDSTYTLVATDEGKTIKVRVTFTDGGGYEESLISAPTAAVAARPNTPGTGAPTISGTVQVGETLTVDTSGIADADGLSGATFSYQWLSSRDTEIPGATDATYTLLDADAGKTIKVRVSFTDDAGHEETLTSAATAAVPPASGPAVAIGLSPSGSVTEGTDIALTMSFANLESNSDTSDTDYIFRADVVDADACEGGGMGKDRYMYKVDEEPEVRAGAVSASCAPGDYTVQVSISSPGNVELASATADFTVTDPAQQPPPEPPASTDATLSSLALSDLDFGTFDPATTEYTASVANGVDETTVTPTTNDDGATYEIKLGGVADKDGTVPLAVGSNVITIEVTAEDGQAVKTYTITVTRAAPPAPGPAVAVELSPSGSVDEGTEIALTMSFSNLESDSDTSDTDYIFRADVVNADGCEGSGMGLDRYMYKVDEEPEVRAGTISASCAPGDYTVRVSISSPGNVELASATADFTVAAPGQQQQPEPPASTDATLSGLTLSGVAFGTFDSATTEYTASVANGVDKTTVTPTTNDDGATYVVKLDGVVDDDGVISLSVGSNTITIEVTAEDGQAVKIYTVTVTRTGTTAPTDQSKPTAPTISSIAITSSPNDDNIIMVDGEREQVGDWWLYGIDDSIEVTVAFSAAVTVTGIPRLELDVGGSAKAAEYKSTDGNNLKFSYTVAENDEDTDGVSIGANKLTLNGGTIRGAASQDADLSHATLAPQSKHKVDGIRPSFRSISFSGSNTHTLNGYYNEGEEVFIKVRFSEGRIYVSGTPQLTIDVGGKEKKAELERTSFGDYFFYTVQEGDLDLDGPSFGANSVSMNGGHIRDGAGNDIKLNHAGASAGLNSKVDAVVPTVSAVAITSDPGADNTYAAGDTLEVSVTFSEEVWIPDVTRSDMPGTRHPVLDLRIGNDTRSAKSGLQELGRDVKFTYTIQPGDADTDGVSINANGLRLNGGIIFDAAGKSRIGQDTQPDRHPTRSGGSPRRSCRRPGAQSGGWRFHSQQPGDGRTDDQRYDAGGTDPDCKHFRNLRRRRSYQR